MGELRKDGDKVMENEKVDENVITELGLLQERYNRLLALNENCFFEYDIQNDSISISRNSMFTEMSGIRISNCSEKIKRLARIQEEDVDAFLHFFQSEEKESVEFRYIKGDGTSIWCLAKGAVIESGNQAFKTKIGCISNINEQKQLNEMLVEQAMLDPLTKLYSRIKAQNMIEEYLREEGSFGKHALMLVNINRFHEINQKLGYVFGDGVLNNIADSLRRTFRKKDIIARIGGDDFLVFIKDTNNIAVLQEKMKLLSKLFQDTYIGELKDITISCSMGVARFPDDGNNFGVLFKNADRALYRASKSIDNGCVLYNSCYEIEDDRKNGEYYHEYIVENYRKTETGDFSRGIADFAFDIMTKTKDVASAIKLLLDKVGKYYQCNQVFIYEMHSDNTLRTSYSWSMADGLDYLHLLQCIDLSKFTLTSDYYDENGIFQISDTSELRNNPVLYPLLHQSQAKAMLQCAFYEEGNFKGCVCIDHIENTHEWSKDEVNALITITKIISFYLLKLRVSEKIKEKMDKITNFDHLTKLPTLHKFKKDVKTLLEGSGAQQYAIVYADFNKFKYINDTLGYEAGDELLKEFANIISLNFWNILCVSRVSADNFVLLVPYTSEKKIKEEIYKLSDYFTQKVKETTIGSSVYIVSGACIINQGDDIIAAIDNANLARKYVKESAKPICCFYDDKMEARIKLELDICNSMFQALENEEFLMYLQPKIGLKDNTIVGAEALTRWRRKSGLLMAPDSFIPIFERNGFIVNLDFYIYEKVCKMLREWLDKEMPVVPISVNVSRVHLNTDDFLERVKTLVTWYAIPPQLLEFELTESIFLDSTEAALSTMRELRNLGFGVSIDDFGAGFSSLNLLKDMTTDVLKLDKEFFRKGDMKEEEKIIVSSIINMAKQLSMKVLSEGVETQVQSDFLKDISCDMAQGYLFAKPMPVEEFKALLHKNIILEDSMEQSC